MDGLRATYSPDDNKLRLYADDRLDSDTYERVRGAGFVWAPRQKLFVAPAWGPQREDLLLELCGEIGDEDTTLVQRAEDRADRFAEYGERRAEDAERARTPANPFAGARLWETSRYWTDRARAAIQHAKYKEQPAVRSRRIKGLEADKRKQEREKARVEKLLGFWLKDGVNLKLARELANHHHGSFTFPLTEYPRELPASQYEGEMSLWRALDGGVITPEEARDLAVPGYRAAIAWADRWIAHYDLRLAYERAMLAEQGGTVADRTKPEKGGACRCWASPNGGWSIIQRVNKVSVTVLDNWGNGGRNFTRTIPFDKLVALMTKAEVDAVRAAGRVQDSADGIGFYLRVAAEAPDDAASGGELASADAPLPCAAAA